MNHCTNCTCIISPSQRDNCGDKAEFHCDICYDKVSEEETICQESAEWTNSPRCQRELGLYISL